MKKKVLLVIDLQNDFVTGCLGSKEAQEVVRKAAEKIRNFDGEVIFTRDTHESNYLETQEGKLLPVTHCISGTQGWQLVKELEDIRQDKKIKVYDKNTFGCRALAMELGAQKENIESIELIGVCTDICVVSNALLLKAFMPEMPILVDASCCAGVTPEKHLAALETMESCQIIIK